MDFLIRQATNEDFESVYPLFEQLWPNKKLNKEVFLYILDKKGLKSGTCILPERKLTEWIKLGL